MTYPSYAQPGPRPGPPPGGSFAGGTDVSRDGGEDTGHPAVDAVLRSLANAARLAPAEQIAEYEAAHQVLQETLAGIDR
ncbi:hypothetical protein Aca07nite_83300 [Actinoplanes capillaceus]|uniref:Uncharacterized protein n=1 Tax=Actinoplanes campanulatus TaxID=113559 RepID=A0ABQ3WXP6_9ACTN|nr:hypothetical protein [Actinoplanes capillaceus]GID51055.1 hypothetical protein Aca07nite_83300 [Actinoplanes capillaceus]